MGVDWFLIIPGQKEYFCLGKHGEWSNSWGFMYLAAQSSDGFLVVREDNEKWMNEIHKKGKNAWTRLTEESIMEDTEDDTLLWAMTTLTAANAHSISMAMYSCNVIFIKKKKSPPKWTIIEEGKIRGFIMNVSELPPPSKVGFVDDKNKREIKLKHDLETRIKDLKEESQESWKVTE
jgi:hypothetical protein